MKSTVELDIQAPRDQVAALMADPANLVKWMTDLDRCEPVTGSLGTVGSTYRMVPKTGAMVFVATVVSARLPEELTLRLDGSGMVVLVTERFTTTKAGITTLHSEEEFQVQG